jgi:hypothetical protein
MIFIMSAGSLSFGRNNSRAASISGASSGSEVTSDVDLAPPEHSYMFCQMVSPVVGHGGGPCTCYDIGK